MKKILLVSVLILVLALGTLLAACDSTPKREELHVMSYNIRIVSLSDTGTKSWANHRKSALISHIKRNNPDIMGLQEVGRVQLRDLTEADALGTDYDHIGQARTTSASVLTGEGAYIFYRPSRFTLLDNGVFWLAEDPSVASIGWAELGGSNERMVVYGKFLDKHTDQTFLFFNTHLDTNATARLNGLNVIFDMIPKINTGNLPFILTGDFNFDETEPEYPLAKSVFTDSRTVAIVMDSTADTQSSTGYGTDTRTTPIDFIFLSNDNFTVNYYKILNEFVNGIYASDHYPILVKLNFN